MPASKITDHIKTFIIKTFWPWFLKTVWPIVVAYLIKVLESTFRYLSDEYEKFIDRRMRTREQNASERAAAADEAAKVATTVEARAEATATAQVWREVAEQFRQENEALKAELALQTSQAIKSARNTIEAGQPVLSQEGGEMLLTLGGETNALPALPSASLDPED